MTQDTRRLATTEIPGVLAPAAPAQVKEEVFYMRQNEIVMETHWGQLGPGMRVPATVALLDDPGLHGPAMFVFKLRDEKDQVVGYGSEQEVHLLDEASRTQLTWASTWTLTLPGRGSLFLEHIEDGKTIMARTRPPADSTIWTGDISEQTTVGPRADGKGRIVGGTGEFEGRTGSFVEIDRVKMIEADMSINPDIDVELRLTYDDG